MALVVAAWSALVGCSTAPPNPTTITFVPKEEIGAVAQPGPSASTVVGVDDVLEILYLKRYPNDHAAYRFDVGDTIELQFYTRSEAPQLYTVQPDGRIYLPELGYLTVRGLTADEVEARVRRGYARTRLAGPLNVVARMTDAKVNEMINTLSRSAAGPIRTVRVLPDGTVTLPLLDLVAVAGRPLGDVQVEVNEKYGRLFNNLHVSVDLKEANSRRYGVSGEVGAPGVFPFQGQTSLLAALSRAGGLRETGDATNVIIFRPRPDGVQVVRIDAGTEATTVAQLSSWQVEPSDIVYVPRTRIVDAGLFVKQYIRDILPFITTVGYSYGNVTTR